MDTEKMRAVVDRYIDAVSNQDSNAIREIYAEDARLEDPIGTEPANGIDAIVNFYETTAFPPKAKLALSGEVRCAGNRAAFPFAAVVAMPDGGEFKTAIIDVFQFDDDYRVTDMKAYWGPDNHTTQ